MNSHPYRPARILAPLLCALALSSTVPAMAADPGEALVSIYRIAPGKQMDFIKWQADREAIRKEAGVGATQWYVHIDGDSWDYISIAPMPTDAQDDKIDQMLGQRGMKSGFKGGLELRQTMASHTDTFAAGPLTAAEILALGR